MNTRSALVAVAFGSLLLSRAPIALWLSAQSPSQAAGVGSPAFEVASVKINNSTPLSSSISGASPGRFTTEAVPLLFVILYAYQLPGHQLVGAPDWTSATLFDITATYPPGTTPTNQDVRAMVQKLLADRFGFKAHVEQRELPAYALTLARRDGKLGPWMVRSNVDCKEWIAEKRPQLGAGGPSPVGPSKLRPACTMVASRRGFLTGGTRPIAEIASTLGALIGDGRPVVDRTALTGTFDVDLQWAPSSTGTAPTDAAATPGQDDGVSIFTAVQEQLGLKLDTTRAPFDVPRHRSRGTADPGLDLSTI